MAVNLLEFARNFHESTYITSLDCASRRGRGVCRALSTFQCANGPTRARVCLSAHGADSAEINPQSANIVARRSSLTVHRSLYSNVSQCLGDGQPQNPKNQIFLYFWDEMHLNIADNSYFYLALCFDCKVTIFVTWSALER